MKHLSEFRRTSLLLLLVCFAVVTNVATISAESTEKSTNLFTGETVCADDWSAGFQKINAAAFANVNKGDKIAVTVSAVSSSCSYPQVCLQKGDWSNFDPNQSVHVSEPGKVEFTITADMLSEMKSSGVVVKGCGYTFTSVDLISYIESGDTKAISVSLPIWTCNTTCPDNWGNSEYIPADKFRMVASGAMLKVHVTAVSPTTQWPQARLNTKGYAKMSESVAISDVGRDYSLLIPDDMLDEIRTNGVRVGGGGYTFDRVTLVTDINVLTEAHETLQLYPDYDNSFIREFKTGELPQLAFSFINPERAAQDVNLVVTLTRDNGTAVNTYSRNITVEASDGTSATIAPCTTDPTHTNIAPYLLLTQVAAADKAYSLNNFNGHAAAADFSTTYTAFFKKYLTGHEEDTPVEGFHTSGTQLLDKNGNPFVMRGFNYSYCWQQSYEEVAFQKAVESNSNTLRIQLGNGNMFTKTSLDEVKELIARCKANKLIAVLNIHDTTGSDSEEALSSAVDYWIEMKDALIGDEAYVIVNIGNEWLSKGAEGATLWQTGYINAVQRLREAGIKNTLMIDCTRYGQYPDVIWNNGTEVINADRISNVMFSIHFYETASWYSTSTDNPSAWDTSASNSKVAYVLGKALEVNAPVCVGEFSYARNNGNYPIDWESILSECKDKQIGYLAWSFAKNGDDSCLDMFDAGNSWAMLQNGINIIEHEGDGIRATSIPCTVYPEQESVVWSGETVMPSDWSAYVVIPASKFKNAVIGNELRLHHKDVKAGAQVSPRGSDWKTLPGADATQPEGAYTKYTITEEMLASLQSGGCIIGGCNYTLTYVEVVDPTTLKTLTLNVPVTNNWVYSDGKAEIKVEVKNDNEEDMTANAELRVTTDKFVDYTSLSQTADVKAGSSVDLTFSFNAEPGFYHVTALVNEETAGAFNIGVDPTELVSPTDKQSDFDGFWAAAKAELATVTIDATFTKIEEKSTAKRNVWLVEMKSIADSEGGEPAIIRGYYAEPVATGKYPAIVHYQGYDSGYDPYCPNGDGLADFCELYLSTRGQLINNREPYENTYGDWFQFHFGYKDTYYYRGAYMDVLRGIDFLCSRDKVDTGNLFAEGASQGGAFTYAAAALSDHKLNAIAPAIPFMGDFPDYFEVGSWPAYPAHLKQQELGLSDEEMFAFLSYFDTKNLATRISSPVMSCIGLQDDVCPPHTNIAPYNNLPEGVEKTLMFNAELKHQTANDWYDNYMAFFKSHLTTTGITNPSSVSELSITPLYNLNGQKVAKSYKGLVIANGKIINQK